jgi:hypothetical protein
MESPTILLHHRKLLFSVFGEGLGAKDDWVSRVPRDHYRENYQATIDLCQKHDIPVLLILWPWRARINGQPDPRFEHHEIARAFEGQATVHIFDPEAHFVGSGFGSGLYVDKVHASDFGNTIAAHLLFAKVREIIVLRREKPGGNR